MKRKENQLNISDIDNNKNTCYKEDVGQKFPYFKIKQLRNKDRQKKEVQK